MKRKYLILFSLAGVIICADQLTKFWILDNYRLGESTVVIQDFFNITHVHNPGAAFGFLADLPKNIRLPFFIVVPTIALIVIAYLYRNLKDDQRLQASALALILGGAIGNFIDRLRFQFVIDFLDFHWKNNHFPAFNIADSAITVGVGLLMINIIQEIKEEYNLEKTKRMEESNQGGETN
jgi:signal peptidase II